MALCAMQLSEDTSYVLNAAMRSAYFLQVVLYDMHPNQMHVICERPPSQPSQTDI